MSSRRACRASLLLFLAIGIVFAGWVVPAAATPAGSAATSAANPIGGQAGMSVPWRMPEPQGARGGGFGPHVPGEVIVKFKSAVSPVERGRMRTQLGARRLRQFRSQAEHWSLGPGVTTEQAIERYRGDPSVSYIEPNYVVHVDLAPDDPLYPQLWGMRNTGQTGGTPGADIGAEQAWTVSTGDRAVLVAVIDTGIDYTHPDLQANVWTNPGEIPGNAIDDDHNGFVDDVHGWDFINNDNDPRDDYGHGTHVAGTIGGVGNNSIGVAGVNWQVSLVGLKFLDSFGTGTTAGAAAAIDYGTRLGVDVMNNSWGGTEFSQTLLDAIRASAAADVVFVAAAGNDGVDNDIFPHYPAAYDVENLIAVAATDHEDRMAGFSNWGARSVHLGAPGVGVLSTVPGGSYAFASGTSMATPHVSGVAALVRAVAPGIPAVQVKQRLMDGADRIAAMAGITVSGGRLNAFLPIATPDTVAPGAVDDLAAGSPASNSIVLSWTATGDDGEEGTATAYDVRYSTSPIDASNFQAATRLPGAPAPSTSGTPESLEITGLLADTGYYFAVEAIDEWGNPGPFGNVATERTLPPPTFVSTPESFSAGLRTGQSTTRTLTLQNAGVGTLDWRIPLPAVGAGPAAADYATLRLEKGQPDPRVGAPVVDGFGGPDGFGYRFIDSDEPGGPDFQWNDLSASGTRISSLTRDDEMSGPIPLGFLFEFYGHTFDSVRVSTNGFLSFDDTVPEFVNQPLPGAPPRRT